MNKLEIAPVLDTAALLNKAHEIVDTPNNSLGLPADLFAMTLTGQLTTAQAVEEAMERSSVMYECMDCGAATSEENRCDSCGLELDMGEGYFEYYVADEENAK